MNPLEDTEVLPTPAFILYSKNMVHLNGDIIHDTEPCQRHVLIIKSCNKHCFCVIQTTGHQSRAEILHRWSYSYGPIAGWGSSSVITRERVQDVLSKRDGLFSLTQFS